MSPKPRPIEKPAQVGVNQVLGSDHATARSSSTVFFKLSTPISSIATLEHFPLLRVLAKTKVDLASC
ncbi:hypothetical protein U9M48_040201 [Paspalum notatum var. saurae]|uniref:Uncharacterized protein n=1 Tax=Paspalum notatum var. saurae TaxID=547442 RepID=A0AAQ3UPZ8_PASNO